MVFSTPLTEARMVSELSDKISILTPFGKVFEAENFKFYVICHLYRVGSGLFDDVNSNASFPL